MIKHWTNSHIIFSNLSDENTTGQHQIGATVRTATNSKVAFRNILRDPIIN